MKDDKIKVTLSKTESYCKPSTDGEKKHINSQINSKNSKTVTLKQFVESITANENKGANTYSPAVFLFRTTRRKNVYWSGQYILVLDFDNGITFEEFMVLCKHYNVNPFLIQGTFSNTDVKNPTKFRAIFRYDRVVHNNLEQIKLQKHFMDMFSKSDKSCSDLCRLYFGGSEPVFVDYESTINVDDILMSIQEEKEQIVVKEEVKSDNIFSSISNGSKSNLSYLENFEFSRKNRVIEFRVHCFNIVRFNGLDKERSVQYILDHKGTSKTLNSKNARSEAERMVDWALKFYLTDYTGTYTKNTTKTYYSHIERITDANEHYIKKIVLQGIKDGIISLSSKESTKRLSLLACIELTKYIISNLDYQNESVIPNKIIKRDVVLKNSTRAILEESAVIYEDKAISYVQEIMPQIKGKVNLTSLVRDIKSLLQKLNIVTKTLRYCSIKGISYKDQYKTTYHNTLDNLKVIIENYYKAISMSIKNSMVKVLENKKSLINDYTLSNSILLCGKLTNDNVDTTDEELDEMFPEMVEKRKKELLKRPLQNIIESI